jgi:hypothetical protein
MALASFDAGGFVSNVPAIAVSATVGLAVAGPDRLLSCARTGRVFDFAGAGRGFVEDVALAHFAPFGFGR